MTISEGKIIAYKYIKENEYFPINEFVAQLIKAYNETEDFWNLVKDELINEEKICPGCGIYTNSLNQPATLLFTDKHKTKCVEIIKSIKEN